MPNKFHLPKGTQVSHGTVLANLLSILDHGLQPSHSRHQLRDITEERPKASAVYVGGPGAFFGAWAASGALMKEYSMIEGRMPNFGRIANRTPKKLLNIDFASPPLAIPVVLNIELQEDTLLVGDEDFALWREDANKQLIRREQDTDELIWSRFRSGGLVRNGGIPPSWISSMQFPQLLKVDGSTEKQFRQFGDDCYHLAAGIGQNHGLLTADKVKLPHGFWTANSALSQSRIFNRKSVNDLLAMGHVTVPANLLYNSLTLYNYVSTIGGKSSASIS